MFTDIISNIFGRKTEATQPQRKPRKRRAKGETTHGNATTTRTISVNGEAFKVGISRDFNAMSRRARLRQMLQAEEQVFLDGKHAMHAEVASLVKTRPCLGRKFVINPIEVEGDRIPRREAVMVTRVK